jgi:hypothetical protein
MKKLINFILFLNQNDIDFKMTESRIDNIQYYYIELILKQNLYTLTFYNNKFLYGYINNTKCFENINIILNKI